MKILHKYRRLIGVILTFTVSVMLLVSTIPASAADVSLDYCSFYPYGQLYTFGNTSVKIYSSSNTFLLKSSGSGGSFVFHNGAFGPLGRSYRDSSKNADYTFTFYGDPSWRSGIDSKNFGCVVVFRSLNDEIKSFLAFNYKVSAVSGSSCLYTFTIPAATQYSMLNSINWVRADLVGIGVGQEGGYSGNLKYVSFNHSPISSDTNDDTSIDSSNKWYSPLVNFFRKIFSNSLNSLKVEYGILGFLFENSIGSVTSKLSDLIDLLGNIVNLIWQGSKPVLKPLFEEVFLPTLNSILNAINVLATKIAEVFSPILADMINFFAPYFNKISDIVTNNFLNLVTNLTPLVNQFVTAISPSLDGIVTNISKNISSIFNECFVPSDTSTEYQEFVGMKNDISNKFPVFNQLNDFVNVLFNPENYGNSLDDYSYTMLQNYGTFGEYSHYSVTLKRQYFTFLKGNSYLLNLYIDMPVGSQVTLQFFSYKGQPFANYSLHNGSNSIKFCPDQNFNMFHFNCFGGGYFSFSNVYLYSLESNHIVPDDFNVNVYGKEVSVLNFDWYLPYKHYGDICVIAFCYLAFIWHTFKRLPNII